MGWPSIILILVGILLATNMVWVIVWLKRPKPVGRQRTTWDRKNAESATPPPTTQVPGESPTATVYPGTEQSRRLTREVRGAVHLHLNHAPPGVLPVSLRIVRDGRLGDLSASSVRRAVADYFQDARMDVSAAEIEQLIHNATMQTVSSVRITPPQEAAKPEARSRFDRVLDDEEV